MVAETALELKALADHLGIAYTDTLLVPTENGVPGIANSMYKESMVVGKVSSGGINEKWESERTAKERIYSVTVLFKLALKLGFEKWSHESVQKYNRPISIRALIISFTSKLIALKNRSA